jgi:hypothetical protein
MDETRDIIVKQLQIKHETKIGLWTSFRRSCLQNPVNTVLFWREFSKREREIALRCMKDATSDSNQKEKSSLHHFGGKGLNEWGKKGKHGGMNRKMMFHEYYDLVDNLAEQYKIESILIWLVCKLLRLVSRCYYVFFYYENIFRYF